VIFDLKNMYHFLTQTFKSCKNIYIFQGYQIKMAEGDHVPEGVLCGVGNPLLDITILADQSFLDKYGLQSNDAIIATEEHNEMFEHMVKNCEPKYLAGGATQNSIRVAQWLLQVPKATSFIGGAGNDVFHDILLKTAEEVGVDVKYEIHKDMSTGKCGAIIVGEDRSLVTYLGAAEHFTAQFLQEPEIWQLLEKARIFYIGGFIIPVSSDAVLRVAKYAAENNKIVVMNLHARFLCKHFADPKLNLMQYVDVLFGNGDEAKKLGECYGFDSTDVREIALKAEALPKVNEKRKRTIVFTQGRDPTVLAHDGQIVEFPINPVKKDLIKDTNGCGDAFVGGFLSQLAQNKDLDTCMKCGFYASKVVIQHYGCNFSNTPDFKC
jgi:adenosine kinase